MLDKIKQELIEGSENYLILKNGQIIDRSSEDLTLEFKEDLDLKIIHQIDEDTTINYVVFENVNLKINELIYSLKDVEVTLNIILKDHANCDYTSLRRSNALNIKAKINTYLNESAYLNYKTLNTFESNSVITENFYLEKINALVDIKNVLINSFSKKQDFNINIYHNNKATISNLMNYGIVKNESTLIINSRGLIKEGCSKAEIRQKSKGLLLDEHSTISANPLLEIDNYDVVANHGASIGAIDEAELYYLMSRGLTKDVAEKVIVNGFINPVLALVKEGKFQEYIISWINKNI